MSDNRSDRHPTQQISWEGMEAEVDEELAEGVLLLWKSGVETSGACQDEGEALKDLYFERPHFSDYVKRASGRAYIQFPDQAEALVASEILANAGPRDSFYERMVHWASPGAWSCHVSLADQLLDEESPDWTLPSRFLPGPVTLSFPRSDIPEITKRLRVHLEGRSPRLGEPSWETVALTEEEEAWHDERTS